MSSLTAGHHFRISGNKDEVMFLVLKDLSNSLEVFNRVSFTMWEVIIGVCTGFYLKTQRRHLMWRSFRSGGGRGHEKRSNVGMGTEERVGHTRLAWHFGKSYSRQWLETAMG